MNGLAANMRAFYYATPITGTDEYGNPTDCASWSNPILARANISAQSGGVQYQPFGVIEPYDRVINPLPKDFPINAKLKLWIDVTPVLAEDGSTVTKHDYEVRLLADGLSHRMLTVKKIA